MTTEEAIDLVIREITMVESNYPPFTSAHEGYAVLLEEVEELKTEIFKSPGKRDYNQMKKEAIQIAAMALKFVIDVKPKPNSIEARI